MAGIDEAFWDHLDARIAATIVRAPRRRLSQAPSHRAKIPHRPVAEEVLPERHVVSDWTGLVETISAAGAAAQQQDSRLRAQSTAYAAMASDLKRALDDVERYKALVARAQAGVEATSREIQAQADARIRVIQDRADARVQRAEERAQAADQRAVVMEKWLSAIEEASRGLLPAPRMPIAEAC